jgi:hypothetical protein
MVVLDEDVEKDWKVELDMAAVVRMVRGLVYMVLGSL